MQESTHRSKRGYAFACRPCKDRKVKCSGPISDEIATCAACEKANRDCCYGQGEQPAKRSRQQTHQPRGHDLQSIVTPNQQSRHAINGENAAGEAESRSNRGSTHARVSDIQDAEAIALEALDAVSMDASGRPAVFGTTSHLHEPTPATLPSPQDIQRTATRQDHLVLRENAKLQKMWESIVYQNLKNEEQEAELKQDLLQTYWCWQHPTHLAVYRSLFVRDMALSGPYFSNFLLNIIYAHACRYTTALSPGRDAETYLRKARLMLMEEIEKPTSIPTIQGLIILGGRECAVGKTSQGWLYTGMAIRMMKDLGIHLEAENSLFVQTLPVEEQEARRRLFYSAYTWDKSISLALGRGPTFHETDGKLPPPIMDDADDDELWKPYYARGSTPATVLGYPERRCYIASTFRQFCALAEIINMILVQLYVAGPQRSLSHATLANLDARIASWWGHVPGHLKLEEPGEERWAPPPHILNLNLLKEAARILLYRPFTAARNTQTARHAASACTESGKRIHELLLLHKRTFGFSNLIYLARYCIYVAATVAATDVKYAHTEAAIGDAAARLSLGLRALEAGAPQSPAFTKSLQILRKQLRNPEPAQRQASLSRANTPIQGPLQSASQAPYDTQMHSIVAGRNPVEIQTTGHASANPSNPYASGNHESPGQGAGPRKGNPSTGAASLGLDVSIAGIDAAPQDTAEENVILSPSELFDFDFSAFPIFPEQNSDWAAQSLGFSLPFSIVSGDTSNVPSTSAGANDLQVYPAAQGGIPPMTFGWDWQNAGNETGA